MFTVPYNLQCRPRSAWALRPVGSTKKSISQHTSTELQSWPSSRGKIGLERSAPRRNISIGRRLLDSDVKEYPKPPNPPQEAQNQTISILNDRLHQDRILTNRKR